VHPIIITCRIGLLSCLTAVLLLPTSVLAQGDEIQVNPNRPTFATPAQTTQSGVAELEFGLQYNRARDGGGLASSPYLLKFGLGDRVELRLGGNGLLRQGTPGDVATTGYGDTTMGAQWTYLKKGPLGIDQAAQFTVKLPTGSAEAGLGSGEPDRTLMLILSRDFGRFHADLNDLETWLGRGEGKNERQAAGTLSVSRTVGNRWSVTGELYALASTSESATVVSNLWCVALKLRPSLVLDSGIDVGLSHGAQRISVFAGFTRGLFRFRHPQRS
jgi:Putative MetA-pathway of phenol degradation